MRPKHPKTKTTARRRLPPRCGNKEDLLLRLKRLQKRKQLRGGACFLLAVGLGRNEKEDLFPRGHAPQLLAQASEKLKARVQLRRKKDFRTQAIGMRHLVPSLLGGLQTLCAAELEIIVFCPPSIRTSHANPWHGGLRYILLEEGFASRLWRGVPAQAGKHLSDGAAKILVAVVPEGGWVAHASLRQVMKEMHFGLDPPVHRACEGIQSAHLDGERSAVMPQGICRVVVGAELLVAFPQFLPCEDDGLL